MADVFYLPRAAEAVIPTHKLVGYALNPEHPRVVYDIVLSVDGLNGATRR